MTTAEAGEAEAGEQVTVTGTAQRQAWRDRVLPPVEQVRPGLWSVPTPFPDSPLRYVLAYLAETVHGPVLIDTGWPVSRNTRSRRLAAMITEDLILTKDFYPIGAKILRDHGRVAHHEPTVTQLTIADRRSGVN